ncbi:hypothetical protein ACQ4LE_004994 [Meloidogyne hapla]
MKGQKLFLNNSRQNILKNSTKINEEEFFIDYAMLSYEDIYDEAIYYFWDNCYYEEEQFEEYCYMDKISSPINAKFDEEELFEVEFFVDDIIDSQGNKIVNISRNIRMCLKMFLCGKTIQGNTKDIKAISKALDAHYDISNYYLDGLCNDTIKRKQLGLELKEANITINFDGKDLAGYSHDNICEIDIWDWNEYSELEFSLPIFNNYCIFFDYYLQQVAFAPRKKK